MTFKRNNRYSSGIFGFELLTAIVVGIIFFVLFYVSTPRGSTEPQDPGVRLSVQTQPER